MSLSRTKKSARCLWATRAFACPAHTLARGARPNAFASRLRGNTKDGRSVAIRIGPSEVRMRSSRKRGGLARGVRAGWSCRPPMVERASSLRWRRRDGWGRCSVGRRRGAKDSAMTPPGAASNGVMSAMPDDVAAVGARFDQLLERAA